MGQQRLQPLMGAKHHHPNNTVYMRKLLIWSLGIVLPFLVLFCIFPSGASLYTPSYNRIVVSQLQVPASRVHSSTLEPKLSLHVDDPADDEKLPSNDDDHNSDDDDDDSTSTSETVEKQSDAATVAENSGVGNADSIPKATKKQSNPKETQPFSIEVDPPPPATTKAKKQNDGNEKETQSDGDDKRKQSVSDDKGDASPTKAKKLKDGEGGDHDFRLVEGTKQEDAQTRGDGDEPEINAFMIEEEQNGELKEETQNKRKSGELNVDSETKKSIKKKKIAKEMPEVELGEALSISGKKEADQPNIAQIEIKKSSKKAKSKHGTDEVAETELNVEETVAKKKKADRNDGGPSTAKPSRKKAFADEEEGNVSILGKDSSLEEDPTSSKFTNSKQSSGKAMGVRYDKEAVADEANDGEREDSFSGKKSRFKREEVEQEDGVTQMGKKGKQEDGVTQMGKKGKSFAKLGKSRKSSAEDQESDVLFLKEEDNEVFQMEPKKKTRTQRDSDLEEMEDGEFTKQSKYSRGAEEAFSSSKKGKLKKVNDDLDDGEEDFSSSKKSKYSKVNNKFNNEEALYFSSKKTKLKKGNNNFYDDGEENPPTKLKQKREKDVESFHSSAYDEEANILERGNYEARSSMAPKKKRKQSNSSKKLHDAYLDGDIEQQLEEVENYHVDHKAESFSELNEVDNGPEKAHFFGNRKSFNKKTKNNFNEREDTNIDQKHEEDSESFESSPYKLETRRSLPSSQKDESEEFWEDAITMPKKKTQTSTIRKVDNKDLNYGVQDKSHIDEASVDDPIINKALPLKSSLSSGNCNYFEGRWTMDLNYSPYKESTCPWKFINDEQSCKTARKTSAWRWKPKECSMKRFKANAFLKLMQGKSVAFVGDKMVKAQLKSLICLLAKVETPSLLYNDQINQSMSWQFSSSKITISLIWSPYLVQQTSEGYYSKLQLDKLDTKWAEMVPTLDVLVLGVGTQFAQPTLYKVKDDVVGCYSCQGLSTHIDITNIKEISLYSGFRASMRSSLMGIGALPEYKGIVMFLQPFGFEGNGSYYGVSMKMKNIQEQELKKAHNRGSISNQPKMEVLHTNFDRIKGLHSPTCMIPSPLADMWNQILHDTLTRIFILESDS